MKMLNWLLSFIRCGHCKRLGFFKKKRINTAYCDDRKNYVRECPECFAATIDYYETLWSESVPNNYQKEKR